MMWVWILGFVVCVSHFAEAASADTHPASSQAVRVVLASDARLPRVSDTVIKEALDIAANWIEVWYKKRIRFQIVGDTPIDDYHRSHFVRTPIPDKWRPYAYALDGTDTVLRFLPQQANVLKSQSLAALKEYVPVSLRTLVTTPDEAARNFLLLYDRQLSVWKSLRTAGGAAYFDTRYPQKHSYWHWERAFESILPDQVTDHLIITNVMILDDALNDAPPHSLIRGGILNGMAEEESPQAVVSTFPIFTDVPALDHLRDTDRPSPKERLLALAHIIGHEFGAHVIQGYRDVYDHAACLSVPTSGLAYASTLRRLFSGPPCALPHPLLDRRTLLADRYESLTYRYLEAKQYAEARETVRRALELDPNRPLLKMVQRQIRLK